MAPAFTRLIELIERGDVEGVMAALRANPALASTRSADGDTLLHFACWQKQNAIVVGLLAHEPDVNARGSYGRTPLHCAVHEGRRISAPVVGILLAFGADPRLRDDNGFTPADWARVEMYEGLDEVLALLSGRNARSGE